MEREIEMRLADNDTPTSVRVGMYAHEERKRWEKSPCIEHEDFDWALWTDPKTSFQCVLKRAYGGGWYCYVCVAKDHIAVDDFFYNRADFKKYITAPNEDGLLLAVSISSIRFSSRAIGYPCYGKNDTFPDPKFVHPKRSGSHAAIGQYKGFHLAFSMATELAEKINMYRPLEQLIHECRVRQCS
jgi:hypothetical protein